MPAATDNTKAAKTFMTQKAIYWAYNSIGEFGKSAYTTPEEIDCRWEEKRTEIITAKGDKTISNTLVIVDRNMSEKDKLKLGDLDSTIDNDPDNNEDVWEVLKYMKSPNEKGTKFFREAYL